MKSKSEDTIIEMCKWLISGVIIGVFIIAGLSIAQMDNRMKEQNEILKEMVVAIQEQNEILKFNPMEEEK